MECTLNGEKYSIKPFNKDKAINIRNKKGKVVSINLNKYKEILNTKLPNDAFSVKEYSGMKFENLYFSVSTNKFYNKVGETIIEKMINIEKMKNLRELIEAIRLTKSLKYVIKEIDVVQSFLEQ